jgi:methylphosphotriester-DNA--protein-cysteine methyltransferase
VLSAEVLSGLTELEGQEIAAGEMDQAHATMQRMDEVAGKIHAAQMGNAKRLKNAEQVLERTTRRVQDMARVVGAEEQGAMQSTLQRLNAVHNEVLAMVFAH